MAALAALVIVVCIGSTILFKAGRRPPLQPLAKGLAAYESGDWQSAADAARRRLIRAGNDPAAIRLLARSLSRLERDAVARTMYDRLPDESLEAEDFYLMGAAMKRAGDTTGSVDLWERAMVSGPDRPEAPFALARLFLATEHYHGAALAAERLARIPGWEARANGLLGSIHLAQNDAAGAVSYWQRALDRQLAEKNDGSATRIRIDLARALLRLKQPARARSQLMAVLSLGPNQEASWLLSRAFLQVGLVAEAAKAFQESGSYAADDPTRFEPAPFVGAARCAHCHFAKYQMQRVSHHATTFHRPAALTALSLTSPSIPDPAEPTVSHTLQMKDGRLVQETHINDRVFRAVVQYAFGSGGKGRSMIGHDEFGNIRELRLSVYQSGPTLLWDVTPGQPGHQANAEYYLGTPMTPGRLYNCFRCHVTNPRAVIMDSGPEALDGAIGCEKCHGPGGNHLLAVDSKFPDLAIGRPAQTSGLPIVNICAQCHNGRPGEPISPEDPESIDFQTASLTWSRCFTESDNNLDCVTCHNPHQNASKDQAYYDSRCLSCHTKGEQSDTVRPRRSRFDTARESHLAVCTVNPDSGCVSCHMPAVKGVIPHMTPTDHFIRVHREIRSAAGG
jgi:tetratricopeptide (TPR) repeat protein